MANMSYCRFENTYRDFCDCLNALKSEGLDSLSEDERRYAEWLSSACEDFVDEYNEQLWDEDDEEDDGED